MFGVAKKPQAPDKNPPPPFNDITVIQKIIVMTAKQQHGT